MRKVLLLIPAILFCTNVFAQDLESLIAVERSFEQTAVSSGNRAAFLKFLSDDSVIFRPTAVNGLEFWKSHEESASTILVRKTVDYDVASNGMMGYTTGSWRLFTKGHDDDTAQFGQYVTVWEKRKDGKYAATVDIGVTHDKLPFGETDRALENPKTKDPNTGGWSVADASMNFLRMSMTDDGLAGAYKRFATDEVRLLIEREAPVLGKKHVVSKMKRYKSIEFPKKVALLQASDMAYTWNPCQYANSNEGTESGNCLQIWKLYDKKWRIVLSVFNRVANETKPALKVKPKNRKAA